MPQRLPEESLGRHAPREVREWLLSYLEPNGEHDTTGRPDLASLTELLWDCTDPIGRGRRDAVARWCDESDFPCPAEVKTFGEAARAMLAYFVWLAEEAKRGNDRAEVLLRSFELGMGPGSNGDTPRN
jgi:hypothetical protein